MPRGADGYERLYAFRVLLKAAKDKGIKSRILGVVRMSNFVFQMTAFSILEPLNGELGGARYHCGPHT